MKNLILSSLVFFTVSFNLFAQELSPYIKIGESTESIKELSERVISVLKDNSFTVLGTYNPSNKSSLKVIAFTRRDLSNASIKVKDRGALAAVFKVGLVKKNDIVIISYTNPDYILRAYLGDNYSAYSDTFKTFSADLKTVFSAIGNEFTPFGGTVQADKLKKYHYKIMKSFKQKLFKGHCIYKKRFK